MAPSEMNATADPRRLGFTTAAPTEMNQHQCYLRHSQSHISQLIGRRLADADVRHGRLTLSIPLLVAGFHAISTGILGSTRQRQDRLDVVVDPPGRTFSATWNDIMLSAFILAEES